MTSYRHKHTRWTVNWGGAACEVPEVGQLVCHHTATGRVSYARIRAVRQVKHRRQLEPGYVAVYAMHVDRFDDCPAGEEPAWTLYAHARKPKPRPAAPTPENDPWSPLL